jgi:glycerol-3-phosphate O-acyltransferase
LERKLLQASFHKRFLEDSRRTQLLVEIIAPEKFSGRMFPGAVLSMSRDRLIFTIM